MCWGDITAAHWPRSWPSDTLEPTQSACCWLVTSTTECRCELEARTHLMRAQSVDLLTERQRQAQSRKAL